ncbi:MAG: hypothetical protein ACKOSS_09990 [Planctomycetia bacterium]
MRAARHPPSLSPTRRLLGTAALLGALLGTLLGPAAPQARGRAAACADEPAAAAAAAPLPWDGVTRAAEVRKAIAEYLEAGAARRAEIVASLDALGPLKPADARKWAKAVLGELERNGPRFPAKPGDTFSAGGLSGRVFFTGKARRGGALLLALHGGGAGVGDGQEALAKWSLASGEALVVAPTAPELRNSAWCAEDIERWVLALVQAAQRTHGLDPDRTYCAGHSMGGYGTWSIGCRHADRFAALGACAGGIFVMAGPGGVQLAPGHVPNLLCTPIWFYNSTDDQQVRPDSSQAAHRELTRLKEQGLPYAWVWDEYHDIGHGLPPKGLKPIADWMLGHERNPAPKHVVWEPSRAAKRRFFWLGAARDLRLEGRIEGNTIHLSGPGAAGPVTVWLNERLVDVAKPVTILRDGKPAFEGLVAARLGTLLEDAEARRDPGLLHDRAVMLR